ncbi:MAG: peptidase M16 [Micavibrio sp.]|nr:peptidase M16 [Micavibrio sp.]
MAQHQQLRNKMVTQTMTKKTILKSVTVNLVTLFLFCLLITPAVQAKVFNAKTFTLDNGLEVVVVENDRAPVITHMIWYKVGAADEIAGFSGMAHYLEHLLFKGTEKVASGDFSKIVKQNGGNDNAFTSYDYTAYFQSISNDHLEKMMEMEADRMMNAKPPATHYTSEKNVVLEERRQNTENDPRALFNEQMRSMLFVNHPYGTPIIGWMDEIKTYEWKDVKEFYDKWYAPNNAVLVISGAVTVGQVKKLAEKTYGTLPRKDIPKRNRPVLPPSIAETELHMEHSSIHQASFQRSYLVPSYATNRKDALALDILQEILSGGPTARLYKSLVIEQKIAISAGLSYSSDGLDYGSLWIYGKPTKYKTLTDVKNALMIEIQKVIDNGVTEQEVFDAIRRVQDSAVYNRDSLAGPAMIIGRGLTTGQNLDSIENWPEDIAAITVQDVQNAAQKYLNSHSPWIRAPISGFISPKILEGETK